MEEAALIGRVKGTCDYHMQLCVCVWVGERRGGSNWGEVTKLCGSVSMFGCGFT